MKAEAMNAGRRYTEVAHLGSGMLKQCMATTALLLLKDFGCARKPHGLHEGK
jgi:hypothetical protein